MGRPREYKTKLMRVPCEFDHTVKRISKKFGYRSKTEYLQNTGIRILQNAEKLNDMLFGKKNVKK